MVVERQSQEILETPGISGDASQCKMDPVSGHTTSHLPGTRGAEKGARLEGASNSEPASNGLARGMFH